MGPSVKFVSPNKGLISKKKLGVNFFRRKNDQTGGGGGARGGFGKRPYFFHIFFLNPSLILFVVGYISLHMGIFNFCI